MLRGVNIYLLFKILLVSVVINQISCYGQEIKNSTQHPILFDKSRDRPIPIEIYQNKESKLSDLPLVIINHGYTVKNTEYSFIAHALVGQGYQVVSIQHDLETDALLPKTGNLFQRRKPLWGRGIQNILFTPGELKKINSTLNNNKIILIGHSNGGDISMMFTQLHPELVSKVISLDSLRYPFPTKDHIPILSIRANDTKADAGVLPATGAHLVTLKDSKHIDLCDRGTEKTTEKVADLILKFLKENP